MLIPIYEHQNFLSKNYIWTCCIYALIEIFNPYKWYKMERFFKKLQIVKFDYENEDKGSAIYEYQIFLIIELYMVMLYKNNMLIF